MYVAMRIQTPLVLLVFLIEITVAYLGGRAPPCMPKI